MCVQFAESRLWQEDPLAAVADVAVTLQEGGHLLVLLQSQAQCAEMQTELKVREGQFLLNPCNA